MKLTFIGATESVTGSKTIVELPEGKILIDCGLYQGGKDEYEQNFKELPFEAREIKAVILTHAHLDHCGFLPKLFKDGFRGAVYSTHPTLKLTKIILEDSASLNESELYDENDVRSLMGLFKPVEWNHATALLGATFSLFPAGHILGASSVKIRSENKTVIFSGDLGRYQDYLLNPPPPCPPADAVVLESTYGAKVRKGDMEKELYSFLIKISREQRVGIIASFAVARAQSLITMIDQFFKRHPEEKIRVVADSPMMREANKIYEQYSGLSKLPSELKDALQEVEFLTHPDQWDSLKKKQGPLLIISSSGMLTGGRIWRHLQNWQEDERAMLLLPGFQAKGTPGRALLEGKRLIHLEDAGSIHWQGEVVSSEAFSSHADQSELVEWIKQQTPATHFFLIHGEMESKTTLKSRLNATGYDKVDIPQAGAEYKI